MKSLSSRLCLMVTLAALTLCSRTPPVFAADEDPAGPGDRLNRLERRVNALAERQEQLMRQAGGPPEGQGPMMRRFGPPQDQQGAMPSRDPENFRQPMAPPGTPFPMAAKVLHDIEGMVRLMMLVWIICNILLAVWISSDIRKRGEGSGIFVALAVVAGIPAAIIYSLVRIGDKKA